MSRLHVSRIGLLALILMLLAALAPTVAASPAADNTVWSGEYYNNISLQGPPALMRGDPDINFVWPEYTSPAPGYIGSDHYSIRWIREIYFDSTGNWTFTTVNDDGMRVWVDDRITMDAWYDQGPTTHTGTIYLNQGNHLVKVEYYNHTLGGTARVSWARQNSYPAWKGEYYNNRNLSGNPLVVRNDSVIDFNWGYGSPDPVIPSDNFSARWTRNMYLGEGHYRATVTADDGVRVWVDNSVLIDQWRDQPPTTYTADRWMSAGYHDFRVEYYEHTVVAQVKFSFDEISYPQNVWLGRYYNNINFEGAPVFQRDDSAINFNWGTGSPGPGIPVDNFSIKWDASLSLPTSGNYDIVFGADDGVRVWVDSALVIDGWWDHSYQTFKTTRYLTGGSHQVHVEYYERGVNAAISGSITPQSGGGGEIVVDDGGAGWQMGGCSSCWRGSSNGYGNHAYWTWNNEHVVDGYNWARWYPNATRAGYYEVFVYIPAGLGNTTNARYWIYHSGSYNLVVLNQGRYANQWISLGTYYFGGGGLENVSLTDVTYESYLSHTIVFDAVKFSPR